MDAIDRSQVQHIAQLSRLHLTDQETELYTNQLAKILDYASHLPELEDKGTDHQTLRTEADSAEPRTDTQQLLRNAVAVENGYVKVPAILDKSES